MSRGWLGSVAFVVLLSCVGLEDVSESDGSPFVPPTPLPVRVGMEVERAHLEGGSVVSALAHVKHRTACVGGIFRTHDAKGHPDSPLELFHIDITLRWDAARRWQATAAGLEAVPAVGSSDLPRQSQHQ